MKPSTTITVVLIMAVVSVTLADASPGAVEPVPVNGECNEPHEEWTDCGPPSGCIPMCNDDGKDRVCAAVCVPQCVCKKGFIRECEDGPCIRPCACPRVEHHDN